ncbi:MAG: hypothetical protein AB1508_05975 [Pseudomonadota bacterium]
MNGKASCENGESNENGKSEEDNAPGDQTVDEGRYPQSQGAFKG